MCVLGGSLVHPNAKMLSCSAACRRLMSLTANVTPLQWALEEHAGRTPLGPKPHWTRCCRVMTVYHRWRPWPSSLNTTTALSPPTSTSSLQTGPPRMVSTTLVTSRARRCLVSAMAAVVSLLPHLETSLAGPLLGLFPAQWTLPWMSPSCRQWWTAQMCSQPPLERPTRPWSLSAQRHRSSWLQTSMLVRSLATARPSWWGWRSRHFSPSPTSLVSELLWSST